MKIGFQAVLIVVLLMVGSSCNKEYVAPNTDNPEFVNALVSNNNTGVKAEMDKILGGLSAVPVPSDDIGQQGNIDIAVQRLNSYTGISAELVCYACIKTSPPQSEIKVTIKDKNVIRIIDISTSGTLSYAGIHE